MKKLTKKLITAQLCMFTVGMQIFAEDRGFEFSIPGGFEASESPVEQQRSDAFQLLETLIKLVDRTFGKQGALLDQIRRRENRESSAALSFELFDLQKRTAKIAFTFNRGLELIEAFSGVYGLSPAERSELQSIKSAIKMLQEEVEKNLELQERTVRSLQEIKARTSQLPMADLLRETPVPVELESMAHEVHRAEEVLKPLQKELFDTYELLVDSAKELQGFLSRHATKLPIEVRIKPELPALPLPGGDPDPTKPSKPALPARPALEVTEVPERVAEEAVGESPEWPRKGEEPAVEGPLEEQAPPAAAAEAEEPERAAEQQEPQVEEPAPALELPEPPSGEMTTRPAQPLQPIGEAVEVPEVPSLDEVLRRARAEIPERVTGEAVEESPEWPRKGEEPAVEGPLEEQAPPAAAAEAEEPERAAEQQEPQVEEPAPALELPEPPSGEMTTRPAQPLQPIGEAVEVPEVPSLDEVLRRARAEIPERVTGEAAEESPEWPRQGEEPAVEGPLEEQAPPAAAAEAEEPERAAEQQEPQVEEPAPALELPEPPSGEMTTRPAQPLQPIGEAVEVPEVPSLDEVLRRARAEVPERVTGEAVGESPEWPRQGEEPAVEGPLEEQAPPAAAAEAEEPERVTEEAVEESPEWFLAPQQSEEPADEGPLEEQAPPAVAAEAEEGGGVVAWLAQLFGFGGRPEEAPAPPAEEPGRAAEQQEPQIEEPEPAPAPELSEEPSLPSGEGPVGEGERAAEQQESQIEEPEPAPAPELTEEPSLPLGEEPAEEPGRAAGQQEPQIEEPEPAPAPELTEEPSLPLGEEPAEEPGRAAEQQEPQIEEPEPAPAPELTEEPSLPSGEEPVEEPGRAAEQQEPQIEEPEGVVEEPARQALAAELGLPETAPAANLPRGLRALRAIMQKAPPEPAKLISPIEIEPKPAPRSGLRAMLPF